MMGRGYPVVGRVAQGDGRGRDLGFPTANLVLDEPGKLLPPDGVYAAWTYLPDRRPAVLNLGYRPTFNGRSRTLEVHVLNFAGNLYGKTLALEVVHRIRDEKRFSSQEALISQIRGDRETAREILSHEDVTPLWR